MDRAALNSAIDTVFDDNRADNSLTPSMEGSALKLLADYVDQLIVPEYIVQLAQIGTAVPYAQIVSKDTISKNLETDPTFRNVGFYRDGVGTYRVRVTAKGVPTNQGLISVVFGDRSVKVTNTLVGNTGGTAYWKEWGFITIDDVSGLPADDKLTVNGGGFLIIKLNNAI